MHLAIIDPDPIASYVLSYAAQRRGHQVICMGKATRLTTNLPFEPMVVVIAMSAGRHPDLPSVATVRAALPDAAIIVTGERNMTRTLTSAFDAGASDFAQAPYNPHELILKAERWASLVARATERQTAIQVGDLSIDLDRYLAIKNGQQLTLTKLELRLLYCLLEHYPNLAPIERLLTFGWDILATPDASLIKTHMSHLRRKLSDAGGDHFEIQSRQTIGYVVSCLQMERALTGA